MNQNNNNKSNELTKENKKYNLKNDIIFKSFFSRKGNEIFLIDFLEALLNIKIESIKIKEEVNIEQTICWWKGRKAGFTSKTKWRNNSKYRTSNEKLEGGKDGWE